MRRLSVTLDDETAVWLKVQPGGRSATIRRLARREMAQKPTDDRDVFRAALKAELLEELRGEIAMRDVREPDAPAEYYAKTRAPHQGGGSDDGQRMRDNAAKTVKRWM